MESKPKKHIKEITSEFRVFWEQYFTDNGLVEPIFFAKLGYREKGTSLECVRFFSNELSLGQDLYVELFDWNDEYYHKGTRVLYKLEYDSEWHHNEVSYIPVQAKSVNSASYTVRLSDLIRLETYPKESTDIPIDNFDEDNDCAMSYMTMKDFYSIVQNKPVSNKQWLNKLIKANYGK